MLRYPILIETGDDDHPYGVIIPDLLGCHSVGDTLDEALSNAEEAASLWLDVAMDDGLTIPPPSNPASLEVPQGWMMGVVSIDPSVLDDTIERVNVTLPRRVLARLDAAARQAGESRSGYIASLTLMAPTRSAHHFAHGDPSPASLNQPLLSRDDVLSVNEYLTRAAASLRDK
jgi:predicted RNase H-like HicB family nuclease